MAAFQLQADVRDDEEQQAKFQQCVDLLLAAGYFRARIRGLAPFDKLVGGMVWCIEMCNVDVDVDLFYKDELSIGQKIGVTERIIQVLPMMHCPLRIEPHQIQGLDCVHIYPVMQWLVKKALENQAETQSYTIGLGVHRFNRRHPGLVLTPPAAADRTLLRLAEERFRLPAGHARKAETPDQSSEETAPPEPSLQPKHGAVTALLGLGEIQQAAQTYDEQSRQLQEAGLDPAHHARLVAAIAERERETERRMSTVSDSYGQLQRRLQLLQQRHAELQRQEAELQRQEAELTAGLDEEQLRTLDEIAESFMAADQVLTEDAAFKEQCRAEYAELQAEVARLRAQADSLCGGDGEPARQLRSCTATVHQLRNQVAGVSRQVALLQRQLDDVPSRAEIGQYQKRFVELYNQVSSTHKEAKEYYATNNVLTDTLRYLGNELSLLHSVSESYRQAAGSAQNRTEFLQQLDNIVDNVKANQRKVQLKKEAERRQLEALQERLEQLRALARTFHATLKLFRDECADNETLTAAGGDQPPN